MIVPVSMGFVIEPHPISDSNEARVHDPHDRSFSNLKQPLQSRQVSLVHSVDSAHLNRALGASAY